MRSTTPVPVSLINDSSHYQAPMMMMMMNVPVFSQVRNSFTKPLVSPKMMLIEGRRPSLEIVNTRVESFSQEKERKKEK